MSMHRKPLTALEEAGLRAHGLEVGKPSQLSDVFRHGIAYALANAAPSEPAAPVDARDALTALRDLWQQVIFYQYSFPKGFMPRELGVRVNAVLDASPIARQAAAPAIPNLGEPS